MIARVALLLGVCLSCVFAADPPALPARDGLILRLKPSAAIADALKVIGEDRIASRRRISRTNEIYVVTLRSGHTKEIPAIIEKLRQSGLVEYAESDSKIHLDPADTRQSNNKTNQP